MTRDEQKRPILAKRPTKLFCTVQRYGIRWRITVDGYRDTFPETPTFWRWVPYSPNGKRKLQSVRGKRESVREFIRILHLRRFQGVVRVRRLRINIRI